MIRKVGVGGHSGKYIGISINIQLVKVVVEIIYRVSRHWTNLATLVHGYLIDSCLNEYWLCPHVHCSAHDIRLRTEIDGV